MKKIIETERLIIREFDVTDAEHFYQLNLDTDVLRHTGDIPFDNIESAKKFLKNYNHYEKFGFGRWAVIDKVNGAYLGWCGLKFTESRNEYDIGFRFFKKHWNKGYATEAAKSCIEYGLKTLKLKEIIGRARTENQASIRVLEKIGLIFDCEFDFEGFNGVIYKTNLNL